MSQKNQTNKDLTHFPNTFKTIKNPYNDEYNIAYYEQYKRLIVTNYQLAQRNKQLINMKKGLLNKINHLEKSLQPICNQILMCNSPPEKKQKRSRRSANLIQRTFKCPIKTCDRSYGSQASLVQHIKIKHPQQKVLSQINKSSNQSQQSQQQ